MKHALRINQSSLDSSVYSVMHPNLSDKRHIVDQEERHHGAIAAIVQRVTNTSHVGGLVAEE